MEFILHHLETLKTQYVDLPVADAYRYQDLAPQDLSSQEIPAPSSPVVEELAIAQNIRRVADRRPIGYQPPPRRPA